MVTITINTDNEAFDEGNEAQEVARIIEELARDIRYNWEVPTKSLRDINGNTVGKISIGE